MLNKSLLEELRHILIEEYAFNPSDIELNAIATILITYFDLLLTINYEE